MPQRRGIEALFPGVRIDDCGRRALHPNRGVAVEQTVVGVVDLVGARGIAGALASQGFAAHVLAPDGNAPPPLPPNPELILLGDLPAHPAAHPWHAVFAPYPANSVS